MAGVFEFLGLVGTVSGIVNESISVVTTIRQWYGARKDAPRHLTRLEKVYNRFDSSLKRLRKRYNKEKPSFDGVDRHDLEYKFIQMKKYASDTQSDLRKVKRSLHKAQKSKLKFVFIMKANSKKPVLNSCADRIEAAQELLDRVFDILFVVKNDNRNQRKIASDLDKKVREQNALITKYGRQPDVFRPSFAVPPIPDHVHLKYNLFHRNNKPASLEAKLKAKALRKTSSTAPGQLPSTTCVVGMSGTGKSCVVRGLAQDTDIKKRFTGGVYLISLGRDADIQKVNTQLRDLLTISGGIHAAEQLPKSYHSQDSVHAVVEMVIRHFKNRHCLFLIDDVTKGNGIGTETFKHLAGLANCSEKSHVVCTTTSKNIASLTEVRIEFKRLGEYSKEAKDILLRVAGFEESELKRKTESDVKKVLELCSGLPVALVIAGRGVRVFAPEKKKSRKGRIEAWKKYLRAYKDQGHLLGDCKISRYPGLSQALGTSLQLLESEWETGIEFKTGFSVSRMFAGLCVLRKQQWISVEVLTKLWQLENDAQAELVARRFEEMNLVTMQEEKVRSLWHLNNSFRLGHERVMFVHMHDLVHEFACVMAKKKERRRGILGWHRDILNAVLPHDAESRKKGVRSWWKCGLANVELLGYGYKFNVEHHLKHGGLEEELGLLRKDERWISNSNVSHSESGIAIEKDNMHMRIPKQAGKSREKGGGVDDDLQTEMSIHIGSQDENDYEFIIEGSSSS